MLQKNWVYREIDENEVEILMQRAGISRALAKVFISRGMLDVEQVKAFLKPDLCRMHDPFLMDGMKTAVGRIQCAIVKSEKILVYGDYDVDGVTGTSILFDFLKSIGIDVQYFIPDRMEDGYGLTMSSAVKVKELDCSLLITVDCGIASVDEVRYLTDSGMQVIVTDHHECMEVLPEAVAILNPHKPNCDYPCKELSGAGVALKLVQALCMKLGCKSDYTKYLDLAALATIADMVPLQGENRIIASFGLKAMETPRNPGLSALIRVAGLGDKAMSSYGVAFGLAPRVNAAGRLGSAVRSVRLFTTDSPVLAEALAKELDAENRSRQETENEILNEAVLFVEERLDPVRDKVLVISGEGWHHGVIGIVASKVLERYNRPCIIISVENGIGKGSGRSIAGLNLFKALTDCGEILDRFGGHEMAAGLTIQYDKIDELRKRLNEYADNVLTEADLLPCVRVDAFLDNDDITLDNSRELAKLAPFGLGNPGPVFGYTGIAIGEIKTLSAGKHLKLRLSGCRTHVSGQGSGQSGQGSGQFSQGGGQSGQGSGQSGQGSGQSSQGSGQSSQGGGQSSQGGGQSGQDCRKSERRLEVEAIGFNMGDWANNFAAGDAIDIIFSMEVNSWNGNDRLQLNLKDIKTCVYMALDKNVVFSKANDYNRYNNSLLEFYSLQGYCRLKAIDLVPERNELEAVFRYIRACNRAQLNRRDGAQQSSGDGAKQSSEGRPQQSSRDGAQQSSEGSISGSARNSDAGVQRLTGSSRLVFIDLFELSNHLSQKYDVYINYFKLKRSLEIFEELGLLTMEPVGRKGIALCLAESNEKVDLEASALFRVLQSLKQNDGAQMEFQIIR